MQSVYHKIFKNVKIFLLRYVCFSASLIKIFGSLSINYVFSFLLSFLLLFQIVLVYYFPFSQVLEM